MFKLLISFWFLISIFVFVYSYGFVDFNLTLSGHPVVMNFVGWSQRLAMFDRPTSTTVYLAIITFMYLLYFGVMMQWFSGKLTKFPWKFVGIIAFIFSISYPFLSSDVFKYLFAAKELIVYHVNPHVIAPQVFDGDTWLRFMRWIHTPSPYGPVMTALAIPYYLLGLGKFVPALYLFKVDQVFWYLLSIWVIGKVAKNRPVLAQLAFALNPLVLVEWLVNAHNDAPMIALLLLSYYLWQKGKTGWSFLSILFSIGIKFATVIFLPILFLSKQLKNKQTAVIYYLLTVLALAPLLYHYSYQYQPWYVTWIIPFAALSGSIPVLLLATAYSLGALLRYLPFISIGLWEGTSRYFALLTFTPVILTAIYITTRYAIKRLLKKVIINQ